MNKGESILIGQKGVILFSIYLSLSNIKKSILSGENFVRKGGNAIRQIFFPFTHSFFHYPFSSNISLQILNMVKKYFFFKKKKKKIITIKINDNRGISMISYFR